MQQFNRSGQRFSGNNRGFYRSGNPASFRPKRGRGENIDASRFVSKSSPTFSDTTPAIQHSFSDFGLSEGLKKNLEYRKYTTPTPIQDQAILPIVAGRDLIGKASTGTGKTAAFLLPLINKVQKNRYEKVLIITPTRELATQIEDEFRQFALSMGIFSAICVGGMPIRKQINNLRRNPNFVIGTPGRLTDLAKQGILRLSSYQTIVLDEVDRMLDMGFINDINAILEALPSNRQSLFFSATMPPKIRVLTSQYLKNPVTIEIKSSETPGNVDQDVVKVSGDKTAKFVKLQDILNQPELKKVLIFIETKHEVERLAKNLSSYGFKAESIHGNKRQSQRQRALGAFKNNDINILVATDVAARGIDVKDITHVINYTVPQTYNDYIHRIGRTGRNGATGKALTFVQA
ncbi:MAG: putative box helicase domain protein [Candidatus Berkelbacteria bacterium]|nr:putative box helicase domain protein [Candidatus Berkelbacteria bacterium]